jgi:hypothetical protein
MVAWPNPQNDSKISMLAIVNTFFEGVFQAIVIYKMNRQSRIWCCKITIIDGFGEYECCDLDGWECLAQVVDRLPGKEKAAGSNPVRVTIFVLVKVICELCKINFYKILNYIKWMFWLKKKTKFRLSCAISSAVRLNVCQFILLKI